MERHESIPVAGEGRAASAVDGAPMQCALCRARFTKEDLARLEGASCTGCPGCGVVACPNCGAKQFAESRIVNALKKLWRRLSGSSNEGTP